MTDGTRRIIGVGAAVALIAGAAAAVHVMAHQSEVDAQRAVDEQAGKAAAQAQDALKQHLRKLQTRADAAASLQELRAQIGAVDANTLRDGFANEPWWAAVRREAAVTALAITGESVDLALGVNEHDFDPSALVRQARDDRQASGVALAKGAPYLAAAAVIDKPGRRPSPVLILARPLDEDLLEQVARVTGTAVMLSDGQKAIAMTGSSSQRGRLEALAGTEQSPKKFPGWSAQPAQLGANLWVWAYAAGTSAESLPPAAMAIWGVAGLLAIGALVFGFKKAAPPANVSVPGTMASATGASYPGGPGATNPNARAAGAHTSADTPVGQPQPAHPPPQTNPPAQTNPNQFGRYLLLDRLGEGGMADVYTAVSHGAEGFKRTFVVKRLRSHLMGRQDLVNMFIDEARLGSSLVHSNIIPVFDFGKLNDEYYMATEYILGRDLRRIAEKAVEADGKGIPANIVLYVARGVLEALDYAHKLHDEEGKPMSLVHRDVSPNNILVSIRGEVKLFDFGIAKAEGRLTQTEVGSVKGNYRFMSAEQAYGNPVDPRSDLCSLGLTLYFALTGESLYEGGSMIELLQKAAGGPGDDEWARISQLPEGVRELIWHSIQADREQRYGSATDMLDAVCELDLADAMTAAKFVERLFGAELKAEQQRFQSVKTGTTDPTRQTRPPAVSRG